MKKRQLIICALTLLFITSVLKPCTSFVLESGDTVLLGKNLDWFIGDGFIVLNNRNIRKNAFLPGGGKPVKWTSRYRSITFNQFGKEFPLGGMNEEGLVIEEMSYSVSKYPPVKNLSVNELQWIQYQLDTSKNTDQVIQSLDSIMISPFLFKLHYLVCDKSGSIAIIEFINGEARVYSGDKIIVPVLANNSYENSLKYLRHHAGFGGGRIVSDSPESPERFVRAATRIDNLTESEKTLSPGHGFEILNSVKQKDTQWSIVYNLTAGEIIFHTMRYPQNQSISFNDLQFTGTPRIAFLNTADSCKFEPYTAGKNTLLLRTVFNKLCSNDELDKEKAAQILTDLEAYSTDN